MMFPFIKPDVVLLAANQSVALASGFDAYSLFPLGEREKQFRSLQLLIVGLIPAGFGRSFQLPTEG
jgi:hypothetical protein